MKEKKKMSTTAARSTANDPKKLSRALSAAENHLRRVSKRRAGRDTKRIYVTAATMIHRLQKRR